ncbi:hypothetical protein BpHYR1_033790 [Brachionus plicatilis]|uniref:Chitin-binding type-2 domain-containing protein n=1 Tax=Brachionus plicatilis TaxID=10195 RepID=A0A3M7Q7X7_BRAPC|nr:hypothetical protein BpHYR1_033790 [Brachionus plicatilis]
MIHKTSILVFGTFILIIEAQFWRNDKIVRPWELNFNQITGLGTLIASKIDLPPKQPSKNDPNTVQEFNLNLNKPESIVSRPSNPYRIQQHTITNTGESIIENLVGGIDFDCSTRPTGHWRDSNYCDIFHACVFGHQKKTYSCPYVGEYTYFDDLTHKCEFLRANPSACRSKIFFH